MLESRTNSDTSVHSPSRYAADGVYDALASDIIGGVLKPGTALPSERVLKERFAVSKVLVRQAIHRLAGSGLVDVRQGVTARVLDPAASSDLKILELYYRLTPRHGAARAALVREVAEKRFTQGMSLVFVFDRRASPAERAALKALVGEVVPRRLDARVLDVLERDFWTAVANGTGNRILAAEVRWWYRALVPNPASPDRTDPSIRYAFYVELARRLAERDSALEYYLGMLTPAIDILFRPVQMTAANTLLVAHSKAARKNKNKKKAHTSDTR